MSGVSRMSVENCMHGMNPAWCGLCRRLSGPSTGQKTLVRRLSVPTTYDIPVIHSNTRDGAERDIRTLSSTTTCVYFTSHPFLWAVENIVDRCPDLKTIRVLPTYMPHLRTQLEYCTQRGITIEPGRLNENQAWSANAGNRSVTYEKLRRWFRSLNKEQRQKLDDLLEYGIEAAQITVRYLCLDDGPLWTLCQVARHFGYSERGNHFLSACGYGVAAYIDPFWKVNQKAMTLAKTIERKMEKIHRLVADQEFLVKLVARLGVQSLPDGLPLSRLPEYETVLAASRDGRLARLKNQKVATVLSMRFGISNGHCATLQETGDAMGFTRERARQLEEKGLRMLL